MKRASKVILFTGIGILLLLAIVVGLVVLSPRGKLRLPVAKTAVFTHSAIDTFPAPLQVAGNQLVTPTGEVVHLRGLMPVDPAVLHAENRFNRRFFAEMAATGANVIRLAVHPHHWESDPDYLWRYIDQAAAWCGELGLYLIIDWHSIGNPLTGTAPLMPELYNHTWEMTVDFWTAVSTHFHNTPHVLFELFNEPQGILAPQWHSAATDLTQLVRAQGAAQPVIIGGLDYAKDLRWVLENPIVDDNVIYAAHIYPQHSSIAWPLYFGDVAALHPVLITEWGFMDEVSSATQTDLLAGTAESYGEPLMAFLDARGIGWTACWYDHSWEPPMLDDDNSPTRFGAFVLDKLQE